jgi:hypothetical protein
MKSANQLFKAAALAAIITASTTCAFAQSNITVTVDEFGNGTYNGTTLTSGMVRDPFSGITTLAYFLPYSPVSGDVALIGPEPGTTNAISDVLRFENADTNGFGFLFFFSDVSTNDPADSLADVGLPQLGQLPTIFISETGPEGHNGAAYLAAAGGPGSLLFSAAPVQYNFISDGVIPEPSSLLLGALGGGLLLLWRQRRRALASLRETT